MTDLVLGARLEADSGKLVGQLSKAEIAARGLEGALEQSGRGADGLNQGAVKTSVGLARLEQAEEQAAAAGIKLTDAQRKAAMQGRDLGLQSAKTANALNAGTQSTRAQAAGYQQLGFQMQDVFQQAALGVNPLVILAQQGGQTASAIALMGNSADGTRSRFVKFATFLSGPWGAALFGAATVVGFLVQSLLDSSDAADEADKASAALAERQLDIKNFFDIATGAIKEQNQALIQNAILKQQEKVAELAEGVRERAKRTGELVRRSGRDRFERGDLSVQGDVRRIPANQDIAQAIGAGGVIDPAALREIANSSSSNAEIARELSNILAENAQAERDANRAIASIRSLNTGVLAPELRETPKARSSRKRGSSGADQLARFGESANEKVMRVLADYDPAPRGIDKPLQDLRTLDRLMADLEKRKPPGFEATIASAEEARKAVLSGLAQPIEAIADSFSELPRGVSEAQLALEDLDAIVASLEEANPPDLAQLLAQVEQARSAVQESLVRPFTQLREESERRQRIDLLILAGREDEARVLDEIWRLEEQLGPLSEERRKEVEQIVLAEEAHLDRLERAQRLQSAYLSTTQSVRGELEAIFAGKGDFGNFKQIFRDLQARVLVEQVFGPALDAFDDYVKENTAIERAVDDFAGETNRAGDAAGQFADAVLGEAARIMNGGAVPGRRSAFDSAFAEFGERLPEGVSENRIVVTGNKDAVREGIEASDSVMSMTPERYFEQLTKRMVAPLLEELDGLFGVEFFGMLEGALSGYLYGSATGGKVGGFLGLGKGLLDEFGADLLGEGLSGFLSDKIGGALGGAQRGTQIAGLADLLGIGMSNSGAQIGGAIGSFLPIPGGDIIGSIAGGLLGGLFGGAKRGSAIVTGVDNELGTYGDSSSRKEAALGLGGAVQQGIGRIADALDAEIGRFKVSIGIRDDNFRVDPQGRGYTKTSKFKDIRDFGSDEAGAIAFAIADAIGDGAIKGISDKVQRALQSSTDIEKAVEEALAVREIEELLEGMEDAYLSELRTFERIAEDRLRIGRQYGFDLVELERINAEERAAIVEDVLTDRVGSLRDLLEDLEFGDLAEGTLADRRQRLLSEIAEAERQAKAGEDGAADRLAGLNRDLIELSREAYGTAGGEYGADRDQAISSAERIIALEEERIRNAQAEVTDRLDRSIDIANEANGLLSEINANLRSLGLAPARSRGGFGGGLSTEREIFR